MAKVKRSILKEIVKECLLEILFEGIDSEPGYEEEEPIREARTSRASRPSSRGGLAAAVQKRTQKKIQSNPPPFQEAAKELSDNPMMQSIFTDTAMTTLQEQNQASGRRATADNAAAVVDNAEDMSDIFEGAGNWAAIAFGETE